LGFVAPARPAGQVSRVLTNAATGWFAARFSGPPPPARCLVVAVTERVWHRFGQGVCF
jgi:hypothetical protein